MVLIRLYGTVENLNITDTTIAVASNHLGTGWARVGIVAGRLEAGGQILNTNVSNSTIAVHRCLSSIGGIVGYSRGWIAGTTVQGVHLEGNGDTGGIAGTNSGVILRQGATYVIRGGQIASNTVRNVSIWHWSVHASRSVGGITGFQTRSATTNNTVNGLIVTVASPNSPAVGGAIGTHDNRYPGAAWSNAITNSTLTTHSIGTVALTNPIGRFLSA